MNKDDIIENALLMATVALHTLYAVAVVAMFVDLLSR